LGEGVLHNADKASGKEAGQRIAARGGETDGDEQRKIEDGEKREMARQPGLQEDGGERNENGCREAKAVNLDLLAGCVSDGHVIVECPAEVAPWAEQRQRLG